MKTVDVQPHAHPRYEHVAVVHEGPDDLAWRLAPEIDEGLARSEAVLVSLDREHAEALADHLSTPDSVTFMDADDRYLRPGNAMAALHAFVGGPQAQAAPRLWSIGSIPFEGSEDDGRWVRYEAAVDHVLGHAPLRAVCAYARASLGDRRAREALGTHGPMDGPQPAAAATATAWTVRTPPGTPLVSARDATSADIRRRLTGLLGEASPALPDAQLVATELLSNGMRHGEEPVDMTIWVDGLRVVLQVTDAGDGVRDPFGDLRALRPGRNGGYGLWLVGQLSDAFSIDREDGRTIVTAALELPPT